MKNDMTRLPWKNLIRNIPVEHHAAEIRARIWSSLPPAQRKMIFGGQDSVRISRERLLRDKYSDQKQKCIEVLMWGYPSGGRGSLRQKFRKNLRSIAKLSTADTEWPEYYKDLHSLGGLGLSTITKLSYFFGKRFGNKQSVIMDSRVIRVVANGRWRGFEGLKGVTYDNAHRHYPEYLNICDSLAGQIGSTADHIEFFLFFMGSSF